MVKIRGVELAHDRSGQGPTFVWGHGLTSSRAAEDVFPLVRWPEVRAAADVLRYDARGHGESEGSPEIADYGWDALALDQFGLCDAIGIDRAIVGGASMGAATALHAAVIAPERVQALVLVIPPTAWETRAERASAYDQMASVVEAVGVEPLITAGAEIAPPDPLVDSGWHDRQAEGLRAADPARLAQVFRGATGADFPLRDAIRAIGCPTLILAWSGDAAHPTSTAEQLHGLIDGSQLGIASTVAELDTWTDRIMGFVADLGVQP